MLWTGAGLSLLPALAFTTFTKYPIEYAGVHAFARFAPIDELHFDFGVRASYFEEFRICIFDSCGPLQTGALFGPYADVRLGFPPVWFGPRAAYLVRSDSGRGGAMLYPFFVQVEFTP
jgi:hypothetical protein